MARMGHDDMRAALIYQQATSDADEQIADRLSDLVDEQRKDADDNKDGDDDDPGWPGRGTGSGALVSRAWPARRRSSIRENPQVRSAGLLAWGFVRGADDGNRTRILSLGS